MLSILSLTMIFTFFFFNDTATTEIYTLSLHDALPICPLRAAGPCAGRDRAAAGRRRLDASGDDRGGGQGLRARRGRSGAQIGRASCRGRVEISVVAVSLKKKNTRSKISAHNQTSLCAATK